MDVRKPFLACNVHAWLALVVLLVAALLLSYGCMPVGHEGGAEEEAQEAETGNKTEEGLDQDQTDRGFIDSEQLEPVEGEVVLEEWKAMRLIIPAIDLDLDVASDRDSYDPDEAGEKPWQFSSEDYNSWIKELMALLNEGPVHYQFSSLPGTEAGNVAIAGHSPSPWYHFYDLDRLEEGDEIYLETAGYRFVYRVTGQEIVDKYNWAPLFETDYPALTFQTCHPKDYEGFDHPERLMVRAELKEVYRFPAVCNRSGRSP